ncbi:uncharacterized protein DFL_007638 [Arthrobotrys flagrans]|uniref:ubiquitinyl hydrolase 1 n=1 Tax=Arthrobotrys flagrans TaxID=97331 RepID=A0A436ZX27_ARTFL|nr:hypothetical protein DFL_007638 [Arthrobotrys flagrans]
MEEVDLDFLIGNIVLPPKLPQEEPDDLQQKEFWLLKFVAEIVSRSAGPSPGNIGIEITKASKSLKWMVDIHNPRHDFQTQLQAGVLNLDLGEAFGLHVVGQNAAITFRRVEQSLQLEAFEVSPLPKAPVNCKGRLKCSYPGPTTAIPWEIAADPRFLEQLSEFLHHMTSQEFSSETLPKSQKGGNDLSETRSCPDPRYITELFTGMMRGIGTETTPRSITKSIRDECNWNNANKPWRRSGMWLVIRVVLQTTLNNKQYKLLMLEVIRALLERAIAHNHESYAISCTSKKLARRCQKMKGEEVPPHLLQRIIATVERGSMLLKKRWGVVTTESTRKVSWNSELGTATNLADNTNISLPNSIPWIKKRLHVYENPVPTNSEVADPTESNRVVSLDSFPLLGGNSEAIKAISLIDFEIWVQQNLCTWCSKTKNATVIETLSSKILEYHKEANEAYQGRNILDISRMILTIIEMWMYLDRSTCSEKPLIKKYSPEIPQQLLEPLLFIQESDMKRVTEVEKYLAGRHSQAEPRPSIFNAEAQPSSFAPQYYATNQDLQILREVIITKATRDREAKIQELQTSDARYNELLKKARDRDACDYYYDSVYKYHSHKLWYCTKCKLLKEAEDMSIDVHEWPLPDDETEARCVLFELQPPRDFALWRDTTYYIMMKVCATDATETSKVGDSYRFDQWGDLGQNDTSKPFRVTWASKTKSISHESHHRSRKFPASQSDVVVKHAGHFQLYDSGNEEWVQSQHKTCTIKPLCNSTIFDTTYEKLSYAVNDVVHTPNETIARQFECPASLTLREYDAFATLRSGRFLQWHNILMELHKRDLTFNKDPVYILMLHAACHLGRATDPQDWRRDSHITLSEEAFSQELLNSLTKSLSVLRDNWEQAIALKSLVLLAQRLVSCGHKSVRPKALMFLKDARKVCDPWIESIKQKIQKAQNEEKIQDLRRWLLRIAGTQYNTFDVDESLFPEIFQTSADVIEYLVCQNIIYDNSLGVYRGLPPDLELLLEKNRRFSVRVESFIQKKLQSKEGNTILTSAIEKILPGKMICGTWQQLIAPATRWWALRSCASTDKAVTVVHLNILEGKLLVNGKPNGRLPLNYFTHETYKTLLGNIVLDVVTSEKNGTSYETKEPFCDLKLYFHLEGENLIIRKGDRDGSKLTEFIRSERFLGDIPMTILENGTQWLDLSRRKIMFYQRPEWWKSPDPSEDWTLELSLRSRQRQVMLRNGYYLLDLNGNIQDSITKVLKPVEERDYIVATTKNENSSVNFSLLRYKLEFFVNEFNSIECRSLRGWTVDQNQDIGTFIGLRNFLKLRLDDKTLSQECILLPYGDIATYKSESGHASVYIKPPESEHSYTVYQIDRVMNRLVDDGTLKARYTRLYLHGLCSGILPDPLTRRTGIAEALDGLRNATSFSFQTLQEAEASILKLIAKLTPKRSFYPDHLKVMQKVDWQESLPTWVQHDNFYPLVVEIFNDWSSRQFLLEGSTQYKKLEHGSIDLLDRARWSKLNDLKADLGTYFMDLQKLTGINRSFTPTYTPETYNCDPITNWCDLYNWCRNWAPRTRPNIGSYPETSFVRRVFKSLVVGIGDSQYSSVYCTTVPKNSYESDYDHSRRRRQAYEQDLAQQISAATDEIMSQYKADTPRNPRSYYSLLEVTTAMENIRARFEICRQNRELFEYFQLLKATLSGFVATEEPIYPFDASTITRSPVEKLSENAKLCSSSLVNLLQERKAPNTAQFQELRKDQVTKDFFESLQRQMVSKPNYTGECITPIILKLKSSTRAFAKKYGDDLFESVQALEESAPQGYFSSIGNLTERMLQYKGHSDACIQALLETLQKTLSPQTTFEQLLKLAGLWPTSTNLEILQQLRLKHRKEISPEWVRNIICFGEAITSLQRSNRLCRFAYKMAVQEIEKEIHGFQKQDWNAEDYVNWLLFEIDSEMLIRPTQAQIGLEMMRKQENGNAVMQLNMGEGKSAVIMPMVTAALADTTRLVRPIVLKPLSTQMFQILVQRLSGLCDRRIYFLPFNRGLKIESADIWKIRQLYERCKLNGDILLALPEHLLSFKLLGMEQLLHGNRSFADGLIETQEWLDENTRDVLDESDEILHIRYQLIYTMGKQQSLEGDQDRWTVIQDFLDYLQEQATVWETKDPATIEVLASGEAKYPTIRIIDQKTGERMLVDMAKRLCTNNIDKMPRISSKLRLMNDELRQKIFEFIAVRDISADLQETVLRECNHLRFQLLVLRGLIADGVLLFILRDKRYRVDYGLDVKRSNLAVPYRAKDRPAVKAEFGHPEVVLTLTCLTYYYGGLEDSNLESCFELLLKTDDPDLTYEQWALWTKRYKEIPASLSKLQGLNLLDQDQLKKDIFPFFKYNKHVIDFFLSELIFPREAKGFPHKLSTSGWDIAKEKDHNTTGFSGTNDNRYLLPTSIEQLDLPQQVHTNSLVLMNILQQENNSVVKVHKNGQRLQAGEMLEQIVGLRPKVRVLLDVGAQILELTNLEVVREWLRLDTSSDVHGAVFLGEDDEILVMKRDGKIEPFVSPNLSKQLDQALVYLDEAHTRGTDLKLPVKTRAAVTLGPNLAKDKFVQGCMRMRKLGNGHSLTFLAPPDIYSHIQKETGKSEMESIGVSDVLVWTMQESCRQIQHGFAVWAGQGLQYLKRSLGWESYQSNGNILALRDAIMEPESRPLLDMYGVNDRSLKIENHVRDTPSGNEIAKRLTEFDVMVTNSVRIQEEQEREVDHEVEEEQNIERPDPAKPMPHRLAHQLVTLVRSGKFDINSSVFMSPFSIFADTSCRRCLEEDAWAFQSSQFVTRDFSETVERTGVVHMDDYLRPVRWILEFCQNEEPQLIFISPYEANELISDIKLSQFVQLHCYAPRVSRGMANFEYFDVCPVQQVSNTSSRSPLGVHSRIRLNLFAGQLFFEHEQYYRDLCKYLSLSFDAQQDSGNTENDGWVPSRKTHGDSVLPCSKSPMPFLREITKMRRKGQGFASTHLGGLLDSQILGKDDFGSDYDK